MRGSANRIVHARKFEYLLVVLISVSAITHGVSLSFGLDAHPNWLLILLGSFWFLMVVVLVLEVLLKMFALSPRAYQYFRDGWNVFDFLAISFLIISIIISTATDSSVASYGIPIISVRLVRLLRGLSTVRELRLLLSTLFRSVLSMGHIVVLLGIVLYSYALVGLVSFGEHDPAHWGGLGVTVLSLLKLVTLDGWGQVMSPIIKVEPLAWLYFVSFIIFAAYIVTNLFIAVVIRNLEEATREGPQPLETPASREEILRELRSTQQVLRRLEERLRQLPE